MVDRSALFGSLEDRDPKAGKVEVYPGWDAYVTKSTAIQFHYCAAVDDSYYYHVDALLMYASKGGIKLDNLIRNTHNIGQKTKEKYIKAFEKVYEAVNKTDSSNNDDAVDAATPGAVNFG